MATRTIDSSMEAFIQERTQQLFLLSDQERKGFIVKRDMQRMRSEIALTPEQLEAVFDSLDVNKNGYLTIEQFLSGFGEFITSYSGSSWEEDIDMDPTQKEIQEDDDPLQYLLMELKSFNMLHSVDVLRQLCHHVEQGSSPHVQNSLETFLQHLVADVKRWRMEHRNLEEALKLKNNEHEAQVRILFEEMEAERHEDKKNQTQQEEHRLQLRLSTLEQDLVDKERQLQDAVSRQQELMERVNLLRNKEMHVKEENERLLKAKEELEAQLQAERSEVTHVQQFLDDVRQNEAWERHKHLSAGFVLAKRIMLEQQGLMHQLQLLQQMTSTLEGGRGGEEEEEVADRNCWKRRK